MTDLAIDHAGAVAGGRAWRRAGVDDIAALHALIEGAYRGEAAKAGWTSEADLIGGQRTDPSMLRSILAGVDDEILVVEGADARAPAPLIACVHLGVRADHCYLGMLSVRPENQGQGLGDALLKLCEYRAAHFWRRPRIDMNVIGQRAELIAYYERRGYRLSGRRGRFPYGDARYGLPLRDDLYFEIMEKHLPGR